jgi:hypothetical protein
MEQTAPKPRISNGGLFVVLYFALHTIARVPGQVYTLNSATGHPRKRYIGSNQE